MSWERALEADARLAAKNSVLIRAALRQSVNWEAAYRGYEATTPDTTLTLAQQRVRARSWAIINIRVNLEAFKEIIYRTWAQAYALGDLAAREEIRLAREAQKEVQVGVDWSKWKPGDAASAIILKPPKAFQRLLEQQGITFKNFSETTLRDLGNAIGEAIELGLDAKTAARQIMNHVASPARALTIAITEQNRAISQATKERYLEAGLQQMTWLTFDPCAKCAQNANKTVNINQPFPSGDTQPPAHPNCRCALAPVIPGFNDDMPGVGSTEVPPIVPTVSTTAVNPTQAIQEVVVAARAGGFVPGKWGMRDRSEMREEVIERIQRLNPTLSREYIERYVDSPKLNAADRNILKNGIIYKNGPVEVRFYASGAKIPEAKKQEFLRLVEKLQLTNPKEKVAINIGSTSTRKYGWAETGGEQMWITPQTLLTDTLEKTRSEGTFKMPVLATNAQRDYTLTHEWGHLIDIRDSKYGVVDKTAGLIAGLKVKYKDAFRSEYSGKNTKEFYAEMFTEWYLSGGKTDNPIVQEMAKELGWKV